MIKNSVAKQSSQSPSTQVINSAPEEVKKTKFDRLQQLFNELLARGSKPPSPSLYISK